MEQSCAARLTNEWDGSPQCRYSYLQLSYDEWGNAVDAHDSRYQTGCESRHVPLGIDIPGCSRTADFSHVVNTLSFTLDTQEYLCPVYAVGSGPAYVPQLTASPSQANWGVSTLCAQSGIRQLGIEEWSVREREPYLVPAEAAQGLCSQRTVINIVALEPWDAVLPDGTSAFDETQLRRLSVPEPPGGIRNSWFNFDCEGNLLMRLADQVLVSASVPNLHALFGFVARTTRKVWIDFVDAKGGDVDTPCITDQQIAAFFMPWVPSFFLSAASTWGQPDRSTPDLLPAVRSPQQAMMESVFNTSRPYHRVSLPPTCTASGYMSGDGCAFGYDMDMDFPLGVDVGIQQCAHDPIGLPAVYAKCRGEWCDYGTLWCDAADANPACEDPTEECMPLFPSADSSFSNASTIFQDTGDGPWSTDFVEANPFDETSDPLSHFMGVEQLPQALSIAMQLPSGPTNMNAGADVALFEVKDGWQAYLEVSGVGVVADANATGGLVLDHWISDKPHWIVSPYSSCGCASDGATTATRHVECRGSGGLLIDDADCTVVDPKPAVWRDCTPADCRDMRGFSVTAVVSHDAVVGLAASTPEFAGLPTQSSHPLVLKELLASVLGADPRAVSFDDSDIATSMHCQVDGTAGRRRLQTGLCGGNAATFNGAGSVQEDGTFAYACAAAETATAGAVEAGSYVLKTDLSAASAVCALADCDDAEVTTALVACCDAVTCSSVTCAAGTATVGSPALPAGTVPTQTICCDETTVNAVPTLTAVAMVSSNADTALATIGDTVTVSMTASETIHSPTCVFTVGGAASTGISISPSTGTGTVWTCTYVLYVGDNEGAVAFTIASTGDLAGNALVDVTAVTDSSSVTFDRSVGNCAAAHPNITGANMITLAQGVCDSTATAARCAHTCWTRAGGFEGGSITCAGDGSWTVEPCTPCAMRYTVEFTLWVEDGTLPQTVIGACIAHGATDTDSDGTNDCTADATCTFDTGTSACAATTLTSACTAEAANGQTACTGVAGCAYDAGTSHETACTNVFSCVYATACTYEDGTTTCQLNATTTAYGGSCAIASGTGTCAHQPPDATPVAACDYIAIGSTIPFAEETCTDFIDEIVADCATGYTAGTVSDLGVVIPSTTCPGPPSGAGTHDTGCVQMDAIFTRKFDPYQLPC